MKAFDHLRSQREEILTIANRYGATNVRVFGSVARDEETSKSDFDFLVKMLPKRSLFHLIAFSQELEELLGRKVDVLTEGGVSPYLQERIDAEARVL